MGWSATRIKQHVSAAPWIRKKDSYIDVERNRYAFQAALAAETV